MSNNSDVLPWIIPEHCEACGRCINACPPGVLSLIETSKPGVFVPHLEDVDGCTGCGMCEAACAWSAICLTSYVEEARERFLKNRPVPHPAGMSAAGSE